jgi:hypothetical protein
MGQGEWYITILWLTFGGWPISYLETPGCATPPHDGCALLV